MIVLGPLLTAGGAALNVWAYAVWDSPINLAVAVFCGLLFLVNLILLWSSVR